MSPTYSLSKRTRLLAALALTLSVGRPGMAADAKGNFAIDGAGAQSCEAYLAARSKRNTDYQLYAGWVDGYLTSANQYTKDTYDLTPWQTTPLLLAALAKHCEKNPAESFVVAINGMIQALRDDRLVNKSELVVVQAGGSGALVYKTVLERAQHKLAEKKLYSGPMDGVYTPTLRDALKNFQSTVGIKPSGIPDQPTLLKLLGQ